MELISNINGQEQVVSVLNLVWRAAIESSIETIKAEASSGEEELIDGINQMFVATPPRPKKGRK